MRTRRSTRDRSHKSDAVDTESSPTRESEGRKEGKTALTRRKRALDEDADFEDLPLEETPNVSDEEENESDDLYVSTSETGAAARSSRRQRKSVEPPSIWTIGTGVSEYLPVEPLMPETQIVRPYTGPVDRYAATNSLLNALYGLNSGSLEKIQRIIARWTPWKMLPPKRKDELHGQTDASVWAPKAAQKEATYADAWLKRVRETLPECFSTRRLTSEQAGAYGQPQLPMPVLIGPAASQAEVSFKPGDGYTISRSGAPYEQGSGEALPPAGWVFDTGGIVLDMDWASHRTADFHQLLALAVVPHGDQEMYNYEVEASKPYFERHGTVCVWEFVGGDQVNGYRRPSTKAPKLWKTLCLDKGRARRVQWNPCCGHLAILCGDGMVYIVHPGEDGDGGNESYDHPMAVMGLAEEYSIKSTSLAWIGMNRIAVGYSDGSIALWSVQPTRMLSRSAIHHNEVVDIVSAYPTMPYVLASASFGGKVKVIDLQAPSYERTETFLPVVSLQPHLLVYSDHLLGFFGLYPSPRVVNTTIGFMHYAQFPLVRSVFNGDSFLTCLSVGRTHPFLLIGSTDGSLWALNPLCHLFSRKRGYSDKIRVFQHEHHPKALFAADSAASMRGASRILQGFRLEKNRQPLQSATKAQSKGKTPRKSEVAVQDKEEDGTGVAESSRAVIHEPLTRITAVEWNPNDGYGCWAAAAMGSGLVRVMDLGLEV